MKKAIFLLSFTSLLFVSCGGDSSTTSTQLTKKEQEVERQKVIAKYAKLNTINCSKLKTDITHQEKNVRTTRGEQYSAMLYLEKQCNSTSECIALRKKQEDFFVLKLGELKAKYDESCEK